MHSFLPAAKIVLACHLVFACLPCAVSVLRSPALLQDLFFARLPYANRDLGAGPRATRFIALAPADSQGALRTKLVSQVTMCLDASAITTPFMHKHAPQAGSSSTVGMHTADCRKLTDPHDLQDILKSTMLDDPACVMLVWRMLLLVLRGHVTGWHPRSHRTLTRKASDLPGKPTLDPAVACHYAH
eukprot:1160311-Pelagomonas_calceolata.AAC.3